MPSADVIPLELVRDGARAMTICNACRYCEGYCAVFPALEQRLTFSANELSYLANLCHDCRECYYSCQYAPPHEFDLNLPKLFGELRRETYRAFAWPRFLVHLLGSGGHALGASLFFGPLLFLLAVLMLGESSVLLSAHSVEEGSFYRVVPHDAMVLGFGIVGLFVLSALAMGFRNFWRAAGDGAGSWLDPKAIARAWHHSATLRYLDGGGDGCAYPDERASSSRRWYHHLTFYGFALSFASTTTASIYHNVLGWEAPYAILSVPVMLGVVGGLGLLIGPLGLLRLKSVGDEAPGDPLQRRMDVSFLVLLFLTSATGLLLLAVRETAAMGITLIVHLGIVMGLFLTMPYGKFVHGIYRFGALVRFAKEESDS